MQPAPSLPTAGGALALQLRFNPSHVAIASLGFCAGPPVPVSRITGERDNGEGARNSPRNRILRRRDG
eukprot:8781359-Pyramimonas_sp.AAC.1